MKSLSKCKNNFWYRPRAMLFHSLHSSHSSRSLRSFPDLKSTHSPPSRALCSKSFSPLNIKSRLKWLHKKGEIKDCALISLIWTNPDNPSLDTGNCWGLTSSHRPDNRLFADCFPSWTHPDSSSCAFFTRKTFWSDGKASQPAKSHQCWLLHRTGIFEM